jgi:uncharacterized membrane protein
MRLLVVMAAIWLVLPLAARAAEPGYYRVTGVAAGDVLNIRPEPGPGGDPLGEFAPGAAPIEVLEVQSTGAGEWGRVLAGDGNGWVSMKFLTPVEVPLIEGTQIPDGLACAGTEPFWSAKFSTREGLRFGDMDQNEIVLPVSKAMNAIGRMHRFAVLAGDGKTRATAMLGTNETCSDGMSDRDFNWRLDLLLEREGDGQFPQLYEGCCRLPAAN